MNTTAKIELALDIYRLCKTEPHFFRAWVHYHDTDRDVWRKETIPESQFGFVLAIMRNPTSNQEIGCITEFLDEEKGHVAGTPMVAYVPHDPEGGTPFPKEDDPEHTVKVYANKPKDGMTFNVTGISPEQDMEYFIWLGTGGLLEWFENYKIEPEEVTINIEEE